MRTGKNSEKKPKTYYENPFNTSEPMKNPENFFGREKEIGKTLSLLFRSESGGIQSVSIVGERKIGKTSLVNILLDSKTLKSHKIDMSKYTLIYLNIAETRATSQEVLLEQILHKLTAEEKADSPIPEKESDIFDNFIRTIEKIRNKKKIILFLDEFEAICDVWDRQFGAWLRALSQDHGVGFVTVTLKPLSKIQCKTDGEIQTSPFLNIFQDLVLGLLDEDSSREMIVSMFDKGGIKLHEDEVKFLLNVTGGNPFFIQLIGSLYFEEQKCRKRNEIDMVSFKKEAYKQTEKHLELYWKNLDKKEREYLMKVREGHYEPESYIEYDLERRGLLKKEKGKILFFSPLFNDFVREQIEKRIEENKTPIMHKLEYFFGKILRNKFSVIPIFILLFLACYKLRRWNLMESFIGSLLASVVYYVTVIYTRDKTYGEEDF